MTASPSDSESSSVEWNSPGKSHYERCRELLNDERYDEALAAIDLAIEADPAEPLFYNERGAIYFHKGEYAQAVGHYRSAVEVDPRYALGWSNMGNAYYHLGRHREAAEAFRNALKQGVTEHRDEIVRLIAECERAAAEQTAPPADVQESRATEQAPAVRQKRSRASIVTAIVLLIISMPFIIKAADVYYTVGYMAVHRYDEQRFPSGATFCKKWFCVRTDTDDRHVTGRRNYTSELRANYCPEHDAPAVFDLLGDNHPFSRFNVIIWLGFWAGTMIAAAVLAAPLWSVFLALPVMVYRRYGRLAASRRTSYRQELTDYAIAMGVITSLTATAFYTWW